MKKKLTVILILSVMTFLFGTITFAEEATIQDNMTMHSTFSTGEDTKQSEDANFNLVATMKQSEEEYAETNRKKEFKFYLPQKAKDCVVSKIGIKEDYERNVDGSLCNGSFSISMITKFTLPFLIKETSYPDKHEVYYTFDNGIVVKFWYSMVGLIVENFDKEGGLIQSQLIDSSDVEFGNIYNQSLLPGLPIRLLYERGGYNVNYNQTSRIVTISPDREKSFASFSDRRR